MVLLNQTLFSAVLATCILVKVLIGNCLLYNIYIYIPQTETVKIT